MTIHLLPSGVTDAAGQGSFSLSLATLFQPNRAETIDTFGTPRDSSAQLISGIPLIWNPDRYPADAFYGTLEVSIQLPPDVIWPLPGAGGSAVIQPVVLFQLGSLSTPLGTREIRVDTAADQESPATPVSPNQTAQVVQFARTPPMEIWITRPLLDQVYVYAVAGGVPLFLAGLSLLLVAWHSSEEDRRRTLREALVGLSAAAFSILPLRAVLIPQVVPGLTQVDRILGFVVALLLTKAALLYRWETLHANKQAESERADPAQA